MLLPTGGCGPGGGVVRSTRILNQVRKVFLIFMVWIGALLLVSLL